MRYVIGLTLAALGLLAASVAGAAPERTPVVQHWLKAEFGIGIDLEWSLDSGRRNQPCSSWSHEEGIYEINAGSVGEIPAGKRAGSFIHPIQGLQSLDKDPHWAILYADGPAKVHVRRTLTQEGQTNACGDVGVMKTKFPPNDCGERTYVSRGALIRPDFRDGYYDLKDILTPPKGVGLKVISIDAPAQQLLYQRCGALEALASPVGVQNVAVPVFRSDLSKLRNLKLGQRVQLEFVRDARPWACGLPQAPGWSCSAKVDLHVDIRRVKPPR
jgi:hypothetical protein